MAKDFIHRDCVIIIIIIIIITIPHRKKTVPFAHGNFLKFGPEFAPTFCFVNVSPIKGRGQGRLLFYASGVVTAENILSRVILDRFLTFKVP